MQNHGHLLSLTRCGSGFLTNQQAHEHAKPPPPARFVLPHTTLTVPNAPTHNDMLSKLYNTPPRFMEKSRDEEDRDQRAKKDKARDQTTTSPTTNH